MWWYCWQDRTDELCSCTVQRHRHLVECLGSYSWGAPECRSGNKPSFRRATMGVRTRRGEVVILSAVPRSENGLISAHEPLDAGRRDNCVESCGGERDNLLNRRSVVLKYCSSVTETGKLATCSKRYKGVGSLSDHNTHKDNPLHWLMRMYSGMKIFSKEKDAV